MAKASIFWTGPAFLSGHRMPAANIRSAPFMTILGQSIPQPSDFEAEFNSYVDQASQLPPDVAAPILKTLESCQIFLAPENFVPMRIRGCLNSVLAQLRAVSPQA